MKVGMIQPNYLPWRGYFDFIDEVDLFVIYDDVQYTHRDWRNRNKIKTNSGGVWITVPVIHNKDSLINSAMIDYSSRWVEKQIKTIILAYKKAKYFDEYSAELFSILRQEVSLISDLNYTLIKWVMEKLSIKTQIRFSSEFNITGSKYEKPLQILKQIGATDYLSGPTAKPYTDEKKMRSEKINLHYKEYNYREYPQLWGDFVTKVSVIDLLFNCGENSREFLKTD
ncbi:MAG: WbqC family protein [Ignavibacteriae bacterium]|nr:WbqC family protein [Ignavibacteriota bacterium]